jgi:hypothetical protein
MQVLQAPVLSMAEMMALNPMMALQMQSLQQATVRVWALTPACLCVDEMLVQCCE